MQIQISWLLQKPTDLDLHCLQRQGISRFSRTRVKWATSWQNQQNGNYVHPAKTQITLGIHPVWSETLLCAHWVAKDPSILHVDSKDSDQTGQMTRLIWVIVGAHDILLVLSCWDTVILYLLVHWGVTKLLHECQTVKTLISSHSLIWVYTVFALTGLSE